MKLNQFICSACGHRWFDNCSYGTCDACGAFQYLMPPERPCWRFAYQTFVNGVPIKQWNQQYGGCGKTEME